MLITSARRASLELLESKGLEETGLTPVYPAEQICPQIGSRFAARTRTDGSERNPAYYHGYHLGVDIDEADGTPIMAIAAGTLIHKYLSESIGGITVLLQHSPTDTGLNEWTYSEYKHLRELPALEVGQRVNMGEVVGLVGDTGTGKRHHSHLHLSTFRSPDGYYRTMSGRPFFDPAAGIWVDPLAVFAGELSAKNRQVKILIIADDGSVIPAGSKVIYPFSCGSVSR